MNDTRNIIIGIVSFAIVALILYAFYDAWKHNVELESAPIAPTTSEPLPFYPCDPSKEKCA